MTSVNGGMGGYRAERGQSVVVVDWITGQGGVWAQSGSLRAWRDGRRGCPAPSVFGHLPAAFG